MGVGVAVGVDVGDWVAVAVGVGVAAPQVREAYSDQLLGGPLA